MPADYDYVFSYNCATTMDGWPVPSRGINCELDKRRDVKGPDGKIKYVNGEHDEGGRCCMIGLLHVAKVEWGGRGSTGQCSICGTHFIYGDVWVHRESGEHIHVGHQCAAKYGLMADRSAWELENGRVREATAKEIERAWKKEQREAFLADHEGLEEALGVDHDIARDLASKFEREGSLSEAQVGLAHKIADQVANPPAYVDAPEGRVTFEGEVVSVKEQDTQFGVRVVVTVKVEADGGEWFAWGTCPAPLLKGVEDVGSLKGACVELKATLKPGRERHFGIMGRPTGRVVERPGLEQAG